MPRLTKRKIRPSRDEILAARDWFSRHSAMGPGALRWTRLDANSEHEMVDVWREARTDGDGRNLKTKQLTRRFEATVEVLAGLEPGTFAKQREDADLRAKMEALARRANLVKLPTPTPEVELGLLGEVYAQVKGGFLELGDVAALVFVLALLHSGEPLNAGQEIGRDDNGTVTLRLDQRRGDLFGNAVGEHPVGPVKDRLHQLQANSWLTVRMEGPFTFVQLGSRGRRALQLPAIPKPVVEKVSA
jgi:hypothetical protein